MALKIRLSRGGSKKRPFYRIVVAEASAPRDGRYVERVGHYNPMVAKDNDQRLVVNGDRVKHWLGLGAQPTERVQKLLSAVSLTDPVKLREQPKKSAPGKKRAEREAEAAEAAEAATAEAVALPRLRARQGLRRDPPRPLQRDCTRVPAQRHRRAAALPHLPRPRDGAQAARPQPPVLSLIHI